MKKSASPDWAARCSRLSSGTRIGSAQRISAAQQLWRSTCSAAHQVSRSRPVSMHSRRWAGRFQPDQHSALGLKGGCSSTTGRSGLALARAGCSRRISPMPCARTSSSVRAPMGQPAPGNSASSMAWPVETVGPVRAPSWVPRQSAGWISWGEIAMGIDACDARKRNNRILYKYTVVHGCFRDPATRAVPAAVSAMTPVPTAMVPALWVRQLRSG